MSHDFVDGPTPRSRRSRLLLLLQLPPPVHGASLMNEYLVHAAWLQTDYEVVVVPLQFAESVGDIGRARIAKMLKLLGIWGAIAQACVARRPSLAYFTMAPTGPAFWRDLTLVALLRSFRVPIVFHLHGKGLANGRVLRPRRICYRWAFKRSVVIQLSAGLQEEVKGIVPQSRSRIVPNGVPDLFEREPIPVREARQGFPRVLFLSNMVREKGVFDLLDAIALLRDEGLSANVTYVGPFLSTASRNEFFRSVSLLALDDRVHWAGPAYGECRRAYLAAADVFVFPSYYGPEAFPLVVLEALAAGLPVVGARTGAIPEIIDNGRTGIVVSPRDPEALAVALGTLLRDPAMRRRMGEAGRAKYLMEYGLHRYLGRMRSILAECVRETTPELAGR